MHIFRQFLQSLPESVAAINAWQIYTDLYTMCNSVQIMHHYIPQLRASISRDTQNNKDKNTNIIFFAWDGVPTVFCWLHFVKCTSEYLRSKHTRILFEKHI